MKAGCHLHRRRAGAIARALGGLSLLVVFDVADAGAQTDPLLFLKRSTPNVLLVLDTANRMQRDAADDYYDPFTYARSGQDWEGSLGVTPANTRTHYRRKYTRLTDAAGSDRFHIQAIRVVGDLDPEFGTFNARTRLGVARIGLARAVRSNQRVARFGLLKMRQLNPRLASQGNEGPVLDEDPTQQAPTETGLAGRWRVTRPAVDDMNGALRSVTGPLVGADAPAANARVLEILEKAPDEAGGLLPAGRDGPGDVDAPVEAMLIDAKVEASRLIAADSSCSNTLVVLVAGGAEGTTAPAPSPAGRASEFLNIAGRRVPVYVVAIAPSADEAAQLRAIAKAGGGQYFEITRAMIDAVSPGSVVPEVTRAINSAVQHTFASFVDFNTPPSAECPYGPSSEYQATSPIVGTVNLDHATGIDGSPLPATVVTDPRGQPIPQRSNVMVTAGFSLPGFVGAVRAFRMYQPIADPARPSGYRFSNDGTRLWVARTPVPAARNIYTVLPGGGIREFTAGSAAELEPYLVSPDAAGLIEHVRALPIGAVIDSTPAFEEPPSLDPPPDEAYAAFKTANQRRRSLVFVGANDGMLHALDGRTGVEVWAFIPFNLLPKLRALGEGQPVDRFLYYVDGSPRVADVKVDGSWRTYLIFGEGLGGTFYQGLDVTFPDMATSVAPDSDDVTQLLTYFSNAGRIAFKWSFPGYGSFDCTASYPDEPYGDIRASASEIEKTVGTTWSIPAVGQVGDADGPFVILTGSGFLASAAEKQANRSGRRAGTTFYMLDAADGRVLDSRDIGSDGKAENVDDCGAAGDCAHLKNALQADPVGAGPSEARFINKAYAGDADGRLWRFDIVLEEGRAPRFRTFPSLLYEAQGGQPILSSLAAVDVGGSRQYLFFGIGSDLLPPASADPQDRLVGVLDQGQGSRETFDIRLPNTQDGGVAEKVTGSPAVAGGVVFFTTTRFALAAACVASESTLYALTFTGGPAYDNTDDGRVDGRDSPRVRRVNGARGTAPFTADRHVIFAAGGKVEIFGDPDAFNNSVGRTIVRILSWRVLPLP